MSFKRVLTDYWLSRDKFEVCRHERWNIKSEVKDNVKKGRDKQAGEKLVYLYRRLHYHCECQQLYNYYSP